MVLKFYEQHLNTNITKNRLSEQIKDQ